MTLPLRLFRRGDSDDLKAAREELRAAQERRERAVELTIEMRVLRAQNHFGEAVRASMGGPTA